MGGKKVSKPKLLRPALIFTRLSKSSKASNKPNATPKNEVIKASAEKMHALMEECLEDWRAERERLLAEAAEADAGAADEAEGSADGAAEDAGADGEAGQDGDAANGKRTGAAAEGAAGKGDAETDERKPVRVAADR